jgi:hypothetical protein
MLTTGPFPLALAFFSLAFLDRALAKAKCASAGYFASEVRTSKPPSAHPAVRRFVFFDLTSQGLERLDRITDLPLLFTGLDVLLDQLAHPFVYRLLSGSYTLFQIRRIGIK